MKTNYLRNNNTFSLIAMAILSLMPTIEANETNVTIAQINIEDSNNNYESREDIKLSSTKNLYRVEKTAQFDTEIITQEDIQIQNPKDIFDLLNKTAGLDLTYQGRKSPFFVNMLGGGNITYILDGAILPPSSNRILQKIPMIAIEEIQIVKSSTALTIAPTISVGASNSGSGNNIGFIIIRTKQPKKTEGIVTTYYEKSKSHPSSNGQSAYAGTTFAKSNDLSGYVGGMISRYDRPSNKDWFDGSDAQSGMLNGGITYNKLTLNMMAYKDDGTFQMQKGVTISGTIDQTEWYYDPLKTTILSFDGNYAWTNNQTTLFSLSNSEYEHTEHSAYIADYEEKTKTYSLRHNMTFNNTLIQLGTQIAQSEGEGANLSNKYNKYDTTIYGYAVSVEESLFDDNLILNAGYRRDQKEVETSAASSNLTTYNKNLNANNDVDLAPANVYTIGATYKFNDTYKINSRFMKANEGGGDFDLVTQNGALLHEEKQDRWEIGIEANFNKAFNTTITYFDVDIENEKSATTNTYTDNYGNLLYYYTEANSNRNGLEFAIKGKFNNDLTSYKFSYTKMLTNESKNSVGTTDNLGETIPENLYTAMISHTIGQYTFNASAKKASAYTSSISAMGTSQNVNLGDYTRVDTNISKDFEIFGFDSIFKIYGRNITDENYATRYTTGYYYDRGRVIGTELSLLF